MNANALTQVVNGPAPKSDLFKLTRSSDEVGLCPNTLRTLFRKGLPHYRLGRLVLVSRSEVESFVKSGYRSQVSVS